MNEPTLTEQRAAAQTYQSLFVPALFGQWVIPVADEAHILPGLRVLDVACGTGVLTQEIVQRTGREGYVVGLDPNPGMLAVAREHGRGVEWVRGVAEALPFPDGGFDRVLCQFGLMLFADPQQALKEMLRVLIPGGQLVLAFWDSLEHSPGYAAEVALIERMAGPMAADALRKPFSLGDRQRLIPLLADAGIGEFSVQTLPGKARFPSIRTLVEADLRGWLPAMGLMLEESQIQAILREAESALAEFQTPEGRVEFAAPAHLVRVVKP